MNWKAQLKKDWQKDQSFFWGDRRESVTFGDPETSFMTTSCQKKISLRKSTGLPHPRFLNRKHV
ncbi:hypothetical protein KC992_03330 [Candidatus Saccharibacteria bacterium]|nr:hypothetical protein [Candidatus Saccharibacteria bacterium]